MRQNLEIFSLNKSSVASVLRRIVNKVPMFLNYVHVAPRHTCAARIAGKARLQRFSSEQIAAWKSSNTVFIVLVDSVVIRAAYGTTSRQGRRGRGRVAGETRHGRRRRVWPPSVQTPLSRICNSFADYEILCTRPSLLCNRISRLTT